MIRFLSALVLAVWPLTGVAHHNTPEQNAFQIPFSFLDFISVNVDDTPKASKTLNGVSERMCIAQAIYHEARGENLHGQLAVASVIWTRVHADRWKDTPCGVVTWDYAFSFVNPDTNAVPSVDEDIPWAKAWLIAGIVTAPLPHLETIDHYHTVNVDPYWNDAMDLKFQIGSHLFYSDPTTEFAAISPKLNSNKPS